MERRKLASAIGLVAAGLLLAGACGGTLEGKYRRGQLPTTSTTGATTPTAGNAAGQNTQGEASGQKPGGTISGGATRRTVVSPLGGRHR